MKKLLLLVAMATMAFTGCSKDDDSNKSQLLNKSYSMYHEDTQPIEGTNISDLTWDSENEFVATVKGNTITGQFIGKTTVRSTTDGLSFTVEVNPRYHLYNEPLLDFGASKAEIKAKRGTPTSEDTTSLLYETGNVNAPYELYVFQNGGLYTCGVTCKLSVASTLADFLIERYLTINVDMNKYSATFMHCYGKINDPQVDYGVGMQYKSGILLIGYTEIKDKTRSSLDINLKEAFESLENAIK